MNQLIAKIPGRGENYQKILSNQTLFALPEDLSPHISYSPDHNLDDDQWFGIDHFSKEKYCLEMLKNKFDSTDYGSLSKIDCEKIDFLCSYQNGNEYYFQRVPKSQLVNRKTLRLGDTFQIEENSKIIIINKIPDAVYLKNQDTLYFKELSSITIIFKGIGYLYREATEQETVGFLKETFIQLKDDFSAKNVKTANRRRIAMVVDTLKNLDKKNKDKIFKYIKSYCPDLEYSDAAFTIKSENELKKLLYGIEQRYYTTIVGQEKRLANSIIKIDNT